MLTPLSFSPEKPLRIGTRQSPLAMAQAELVRQTLCDVVGLSNECCVLVPMIASGDRVLDRPLADIGGKALWTKELERALIENVVDIAVHSMKDVETTRPDVYQIAAMLPRADVRDRIVGAASIAALPARARVGTSSPRRAAQLLSLRPDLEITGLRGNVNSRLAQIKAGVADATLLAAAGLDRLGMGDIGMAIAPEDMLPAASQGAIGIDRLTARSDLQALLDTVNDVMTFAAVMAERQFLEALGGSCHSPIAALAIVENDQIWLRGEILSANGRDKVAGEARFDISDREAPITLAEQLLNQASPAILCLLTP
jgi:hydroxymethylbilane synthase